MNYIIEINNLVLIAALLLAFSLGWALAELYHRAEARRLNAENELLWKHNTLALAVGNDEEPELQPYRGASRDRSLPGKARRSARKAANRVG